MSASWLNKPNVDEDRTGWGRDNRDQVQLFKVTEDFAEFEDVYKGKCKRYWRDETTFSVHGLEEDVYSHHSGVSTGDVVASYFNKQSGRWEVIPAAAGGPSSIIRFTIDAVDEDCEFCEATVDAVGCGQTSPRVDDILYIFDGLECILDVPPEDVIGLRGYAVKMEVPDEEYDSCRWEILRLCCSEV